MDSLNLLERENEFKKLNKQLEKKTESLMKEIETAMAKKDIFSDFPRSLTLSPKYEKKKHFCDSSSSVPKETVDVKKLKSPKNYVPLKCNKDTNKIETAECAKEKQCQWCVLAPTKKEDELQFLFAFVSVCVEDNILPKSFMKDKVNFENVCKCLSAKIKLLQEQIEKLTININLKTKQCEQYMSQLAELESTRMKLRSRADSMRADNAAVLAKCALLQNRLTEKDKAYKEQRSEAERATLEVKKLKARNSQLEALCAAHEELVGGLRQQLQAARLAEKEARECSRSSSARQASVIFSLQERVRGLASAASAHARLVRNLRAQNKLLATEGALRAVEKEFDMFLSQDL